VLRVAVTVFQENSHYSVYTLIGWGAPVVMTTAWAVTTAMKYSASKYVPVCSSMYQYVPVRTSSLKRPFIHLRKGLTSCSHVTFLRIGNTKKKTYNFLD
jgi:hypothetical protein